MEGIITGGRVGQFLMGLMMVFRGFDLGYRNFASSPLIGPEKGLIEQT